MLSSKSRGGHLRILLPPRLGAVAAHALPCASLVDVGTDHGLLPLAMLLERQVSRALGLDVNPQPLERAAARASSLGIGQEQGLELRRSDGLQAMSPGEAEVAVLAGMGGATIARILAARPALTTPGAPGGLRRVVASPHREPERVRAWARAAGWALVDEDLVVDAGRIYPILVLEPGGAAPDWDEADLRLGPLLRLRRPPLFHVALERALAAERRALEAALAGASTRGAAAIAARIALLQRELGGPL